MTGERTQNPKPHRNTAEAHDDVTQLHYVLFLRSILAGPYFEMNWQAMNVCDLRTPAGSRACPFVLQGRQF